MPRLSALEQKVYAWPAAYTCALHFLAVLASWGRDVTSPFFPADGLGAVRRAERTPLRAALRGLLAGQALFAGTSFRFDFAN